MQNAGTEKDMIRKNGFLFFWGDWPSNWEFSPFKLGGVQYNCVEQYMMAAKARLFDDKKTLAKIMAATDPSDQKRYGREVEGFSEPKWAAIRYDVVLRATVEKYRQNPELLKLLLATGTDRFVEASPTDRIWGIGMRKDSRGIENPANWRGTNLLGKAIDEARAIIRKELGL